MIPLTRIRLRRDKNCFQISVSALLIHFAGVKSTDDRFSSCLPWCTQAWGQCGPGHGEDRGLPAALAVGYLVQIFPCLHSFPLLGFTDTGERWGQGEGEENRTPLISLFSFYPPH